MKPFEVGEAVVLATTIDGLNENGSRYEIPEGCLGTIVDVYEPLLERNVICYAVRFRQRIKIVGVYHHELALSTSEHNLHNLAAYRREDVYVNDVFFLMWKDSDGRLLRELVGKVVLLTLDEASYSIPNLEIDVKEIHVERPDGAIVIL